MPFQQPGNSETNGPQQQSSQPPQQAFYGVQLNEMTMLGTRKFTVTEFVATEISSLFGKRFRCRRIKSGIMVDNSGHLL